MNLRRDFRVEKYCAVKSNANDSDRNLYAAQSSSFETELKVLFGAVDSSLPFRARVESARPNRDVSDLSPATRSHLCGHIRRSSPCYPALPSLSSGLGLIIVLTRLRFVLYCWREVVVAKTISVPALASTSLPEDQSKAKVQYHYDAISTNNLFAFPCAPQGHTLTTNNDVAISYLLTPI